MFVLYYDIRWFPEHPQWSTQNCYSNAEWSHHSKFPSSRTVLCFLPSNFKTTHDRIHTLFNYNLQRTQIRTLSRRAMASMSINILRDHRIGAYDALLKPSFRTPIWKKFRNSHLGMLRASLDVSLSLGLSFPCW